MAFGQLQSGGLFEPPVDEGVGVQDWASMTSMGPGHPLVGGSAGTPGYGSAATRQVAVGQTNAMATVASGSPARAHWSELLNLKGNPIGWVLIMAILYLGLMHIHAHAGANAGFGFKGGK